VVLIAGFEVANVIVSWHWQRRFFLRASFTQPCSTFVGGSLEIIAAYSSAVLLKRDSPRRLKMRFKARFSLEVGYFFIGLHGGEFQGDLQEAAGLSPSVLPSAVWRTPLCGRVMILPLTRPASKYKLAWMKRLLGANDSRCENQRRRSDIPFRERKRDHFDVGDFSCTDLFCFNWQRRGGGPCLSAL
jgi:hypothetical protein